jgi:L-fucose isomerase-like protein
VIPIDFKDLHEAYEKSDPDEAAAWADRWMKAAEKVVEPTRDEIVRSGAMYLAELALLRKHNAQAITINCLGGFYGGHIRAYPCLGFLQLNNDGLVGACEADQQSTISMLAMTYLSGRPGYISDPVIDTSKNQIIYAHCVASTKVFGPKGKANPYHIRSHSEDRKGAAVRSLMPLGYMTTTVKFDPLKKQILIHQGKAVANIDEDKACRSKLAVEVKGDIDKLFTEWDQWSWHRVTVYGDLKEPLSALARALRMKVIEEA